MILGSCLRCSLHSTICEVHGDRYQEEWSAIVQSTELPQPRAGPRSNAVSESAKLIRDALGVEFSP